MVFRRDYFLSAIALKNYQKVTGKDAEAWLKLQGYTYISVDDDGLITARNKDNKILTGLRVYSRLIPVIPQETTTTTQEQEA